MKCFNTLSIVAKQKVLLFTIIYFNIKNTVFWDVAPHGLNINRRFEGTCREEKC
jgi:hypothetical protein